MAAESTSAPSDDIRTISLEECRKHTTDKSCWLVVHGKVYDVTNFLEEHPGGYDIIVTATGRDATQDFEEIGHSNSAKRLLEKYIIGKYEGGDSAPAVKEVASSKVTTLQHAPKTAAMRTFHVILPMLILAMALILNFYSGSRK